MKVGLGHGQSRARRTSLLATFTAAILCGAFFCAPASAQGANPKNGVVPLKWAYQLQGDVSGLGSSDAELLVVDVDHVRHAGGLSVLRRRAAGLSSRRVLSYLSIGEAEVSRSYWKACCAASKPAWVTTREQGWPGNYAVRFWDDGWQSLARARLTEIIDAGYDGAYLDRVDIWEVMKDERATARADMITFVRSLSSMAKKKRPGFSIFVQNGEELLSDKQYVDAIDGIAKEDLLYGIKHDEKRNDRDVIKSAIRDLDRAKKAGKPVLVVEYLSDAKIAEVVRQEIIGVGYAPLISQRNLAGDKTPTWSGQALPPASVTSTVTVPPIATSAPSAWDPAEVAAAKAKCDKLLSVATLQYVDVPPIRLGECGSPALIRVSKVGKVSLVPAITINCDVAAKLATWVNDVVAPAARTYLNEDVVQIRTAAGYHCRARIGGSEKSLSEHATANAIDISQFSTLSGRKVDVRLNWGAVERAEPVPEKTAHVAKPLQPPPHRLTPQSEKAAEATKTAETMFLREVHMRSCGAFTTVLGPNANDSHLDHIHLDLAKRAGSAYCR